MSLTKRLEFAFLLEESVKVVPLVSETDTLCLGECRLSISFTKVYSEITFSKNLYYIEISQLICFTNDASF